MRLIELSAGILEATGQAVVVGIMEGMASETRAKWDMGFCMFRKSLDSTDSKPGKLWLGMHRGNPQDPMRAFTKEHGLKFINAVLDHGGCYRAITCIRWIPEECGSGWVTAISLDPLHDEIVHLPQEDIEMFEDMKECFENEKDLDLAGVS